MKSYATKLKEKLEFEKDHSQQLSTKERFEGFRNDILSGDNWYVIVPLAFTAVLTVAYSIMWFFDKRSSSKGCDPSTSACDPSKAGDPSTSEVGDPSKVGDPSTSKVGSDENKSIFSPSNTYAAPPKDERPKASQSLGSGSEAEQPLLDVVAIYQQEQRAAQDMASSERKEKFREETERRLDEVEEQARSKYTSARDQRNAEIAKQDQELKNLDESFNERFKKFGLSDQADTPSSRSDKDPEDPSTFGGSAPGTVAASSGDSGPASSGGGASPMPGPNLSSISNTGAGRLEGKALEGSSFDDPSKMGSALIGHQPPLQGEGGQLGSFLHSPSMAEISGKLRGLEISSSSQSKATDQGYDPSLHYTALTTRARINILEHELEQEACERRKAGLGVIEKRDQMGCTSDGSSFYLSKISRCFASRSNSNDGDLEKMPPTPSLFPWVIDFGREQLENVRSLIALPLVQEKLLNLILTIGWVFCDLPFEFLAPVFDAAITWHIDAIAIISLLKHLL